MPPSEPPLPTFIIIGAQKSATRWLRHNLGQHPQIFTAPDEIKFFNHPKRMQQLGTQWYRNQFRSWSGEPIVGEATPGYLIWRHDPVEVAARIDSTLPDVRLLAVLRDPVDRARSALVHHRRLERVHPDVGVLDQIRSVDPDQDWMGLVNGGLYGASLRPYVERFGARLDVLLYESIAGDPSPVFAEALDHVGATPGFEPDSLHDVIRSNQPAPGDWSEVSPEDRAELFGYFSDDIDQLEQLISRDLSAWRP